MLPAGRESEDAHSRDVTDWQAAWKVLMLTTLGAGLYTVLSGLKPFHWLKAFHVFTWLGLKAASDWGWVLSPSLGYVGQGAQACMPLELQQSAGHSCEHKQPALLLPCAL